MRWRRNHRKGGVRAGAAAEGDDFVRTHAQRPRKRAARALYHATIDRHAYRVVRAAYADIDALRVVCARRISGQYELVAVVRKDDA